MGYFELRLCPKCKANRAALPVIGVIAGTILPLFCNHVGEFSRHDHLPEVEIRAALIEPTVARVTSSSTTITPASGTLSLLGYAPTATTSRYA